MSELIIFCGLTAKINIPRDIGTKCYEFGKKLLEDTTEKEMGLIASSDVPEQMNRMIRELWLGGKGKQPATWETLIEVLKNVDLTDLTKEIEPVVFYIVKANYKKTVNSVTIFIILCFLYSFTGVSAL